MSHSVIQRNKTDIRSCTFLHESNNKKTGKQESAQTVSESMVHMIIYPVSELSVNFVNSKRA